MMRPLVLLLVLGSHVGVSACTTSHPRNGNIHQRHARCVSSDLRVLLDPCGGVGAVMRAVIVPWYSRCVSDLKKGSGCVVQVSGCVVQEAFWSRALFLCTIVVQKGVAVSVDIFTLGGEFWARSDIISIL